MVLGAVHFVFLHEVELVHLVQVLVLGHAQQHVVGVDVLVLGHGFVVGLGWVLLRVDLLVHVLELSCLVSKDFDFA